MSVLQLSSIQPDPANAIVSLSSGDGTYQLLLIQNMIDGTGFTLPNGSYLWDSAPDHFTLKGGDWAPTNAGDTIFLIHGNQGYDEVGRWGSNTNVLTESLWKVVSSILQPVNLSWPIEIDS